MALWPWKLSQMAQGEERPERLLRLGFLIIRAVKELKLSYYIGETLLFTIYTHYGNLI